MPSRRPFIGALCATAALAAPSVAAAGPMVDTYDAAVAAPSADLGTYYVKGAPYMGLAYIDLAVSAKATYTGSLKTSVAHNTDYLRQGGTWSAGRMSPLQSGRFNVTWHVTGTKTENLVESGVDRTRTATASCAPRFSGAAYTCTANAGTINLFSQPAMPGSNYTNMVLHARFTVTPEGAVVKRSFFVGGDPNVQTKTLSLNLTSQLDTLKVPCAGVGSPATYKLSPVEWSPATSVYGWAELQEGLMDPFIGATQQPAIYDYKWVWGDKPTASVAPTFAATGPGKSTAVGTVLANNVKPTIGDAGPFTGSAGMPIQFTAPTTSKCPIETRQWTFSDGSTEYGAPVHHAFAKPGTYTGKLTVTDSSGLATSKTFSVAVS